MTKKLPLINVILCGGTGSRLWPLSRECKPKPFISLLDQQTLFQQTAIGNHKFCSELVIVCNVDHACLVQKQLAECKITPRSYIFEAVPKNTAAAVALALSALPSDAILLITPADHYIDYSEEYYESLQKAYAYAKKGNVVIFGIQPRTPETGYGYIEALNDDTVKRFHEKPDAETACRYLLQNNFYWNSGMICAKASSLQKAFKKYAPELFVQAEQAYTSSSISSEPPVAKVPIETMINMPAISIDCALLEKMADLKCVKANFRWSDVGSFDSIFTHIPKDEAGNAISAQQMISVDSKNNLVIGSDRMISTVDVDDLVIIDTPDALLISKRGSTQKVKNVVNQLQSRKTTLHRVHHEETRFWGSFTVLTSLEKYKVKQLVISPGKRLSLQKHAHRSEHWVVVSGTPLITIGEEQRLLHPNQSAYIPCGEVHRLENPGDVDAVIIEVQYGDYTGEDDIIRIEDDFVALR